ncbi:uncharacterized protein [Gossypium hirsutum]|uniref:RNase H type-1 domain-containing protein n=1 Tax=Gossypium hirsutum TaxID=3635 RepID=A0A1U8IDK6_GOSHI|nr:uncharacterized protein LOC107895390 [Gossypium hirsutum]
MGDFWSLWEGHNPLFVWRSICAAKGLLARGIRWQLDVDDDTFYVASSTLPGLESLRVTDLLQLIGSAWDVDLIDGLMVPSDIIRILQIPVSLFHTRDRLIWHYEKHGTYTVNSAYRLAFNMFESTRYLVVDGPWLKLWNSTLPPKLKILFGAVFVALPTRCRLAERGCMVLTSCVRCGGQENVDHVFLSCTIVVAICGLAGVVLPASGRLYGKCCYHLVEFVVFSKLGPLEECGYGWPSNPRLCHSVLIRLTCFTCGSRSSAIAALLAARSCRSWSPPLERAFKCNVDSASFSAQQQTEFANVLRDARGSFIKAFSGSCPALLYPRLAEAFTVREALSWLKSEDYLQVILEGDCMQIFSALCTASPNFSEFGVLLEDCHFLQTYFQSLTFCSLRRSSNRAAHKLARALFHANSSILLFQHVFSMVYILKKNGDDLLRALKVLRCKHNVKN